MRMNNTWVSGISKISANLNFTTLPIYTLNRTSRPSISWTFNIYHAQRPLLSFLNNSVSFEFISSSMTIFSLSTKAFLPSWKIDSNNVNNPYFSWQRHFVKNSLHRMINDILKHAEFNSVHLILVPNSYSPLQRFFKSLWVIFMFFSIQWSASIYM